MQTCPEDRIVSRSNIAGASIGAKTVRVLLVLILGVVGSIPLVLVTPPFQAPDEVQHFYRAYELSELRLRAEVQNGVSGDTLPDSLSELVKSSVYTPDGIHYPAMPSPLTRTLRLSSISLVESSRRFVAFPGSAFYSPLPYIPQVLGIALGRWCGLGPLYLLYLGRLFNCLAALAVIGLAVYLIPSAEELVIVVGLLPMSLFLYASLSPDAAVISCALLFIAVARSASASGKWETRNLAMAAVAAAVLCSVKPVYAPLLLAGFVPGLMRGDRAAIVVRSHLILIVVALGVAAGWLLFARSSMTSPLGGGHPSLQMSFVLHHPASFIQAVGHSLSIREVLYRYHETVGRFGWLTVPLQPVLVYLLPLCSFGIIWKLGASRCTRRSFLCAIWYLALALASAVLVMGAMYLMSARVGQNEVTGVQGRYFIPILVLAGMGAMELAPVRQASAPRWRNLAWIAGIIVVQIAATDATIIRAFHVL